MTLHNETFPYISRATGVALATLLAIGCGDDAGSDDGAGSDTGPTTTASTTDNPTDTDTPADSSGATGMATSDDTASEDTGEPGCEIEPGDWAAPDWDTNAADALAVRAALDTLTGDDTMRGAETGAVAIASVDDLNAIWDGDPSLMELANPGYAPVVQDSFAEFIAILEAGEQDLVDDDGLWTPGPDGGVWADDNRGINEGGIEVRQMIDKGGYSAGLMYHYAATLTEGDIDEATIDAIAAAWGNNAALDAEGDLTDSAGYANSMGFHAQMAEALTAAKAYAGDPACTGSRDNALVRFFNTWELSMYARLVFYGNRAEGKLLEATTDTELSSALRDLAEGVALVAGFTGLPDYTGPLAGTRISSQADVDAVMDAYGLDLGDLGASTMGPLVESLPNLEAAVEASEGVVMDAFDVSAEDIAGYAMPTPG